MQKRRSIIALLIALNITLINSNNLFAANNFNDINKVKNTYKFENVDNIYQQNLLNNEMKFFKEKNVNYSHEDQYITKTEINDMLSNLNYHQKFDQKNTMSASEIVAEIAINSNAFENEYFKSVFNTKDSLGFQVILNMIVEDIINKETNDIDEDLYLIKNMKILTLSEDFIEQYLDTETNGLYYDEELNILYVYRDSLFNNNEKLESKEYYYTLAKNLVHIINDVRQVSVNNVNYLKYLKGFNPVFLEDASSRYPIIYKKYDYYKDSSYLLEKEQKILLLLSMFNNVNPKEFYNAIYDEDAKKVFDNLNLKSSDDVYDFYKVMYAIDASSYKNNFFLNYENNNEDYTLSEQVGYSYNETIYNKYVNNLLEYMTNHSMPLEENLTMYYIALDLIGSNIGQSKNYNDLITINNISNSHVHYINFIKKYYNVDDNEINQLIDKEVLSNIVSLQKDLGIKKNNMRNYYRKYPMLKVYSESIIPVEGYKNILNSEKILNKKI